MASRAEAAEGAEGAAAGQEQQAVRLSPDDWAIINARFERLEVRCANLNNMLGLAVETANRADQRGMAHQPFIDRLSKAIGKAEAQPRPIDGRTLMVLGSWCAVLLAQMNYDALDSGASAVTVEVTMTPEQMRELRSAMANVKHAMEHMKTYVGSEPSGE